MESSYVMISWVVHGEKLTLGQGASDWSPQLLLHGQSPRETKGRMSHPINNACAPFRWLHFPSDMTKEAGKLALSSVESQILALSKAIQKFKLL